MIFFFFAEVSITVDNKRVTVRHDDKKWRLLIRGKEPVLVPRTPETPRAPMLLPRVRRHDCSQRITPTRRPVLPISPLAGPSWRRSTGPESKVQADSTSACPPPAPVAKPTVVHAGRRLKIKKIQLSRNTKIRRCTIYGEEFTSPHSLNDHREKHYSGQLPVPTSPLLPKNKYACRCQCNGKEEGSLITQWSIGARVGWFLATTPTSMKICVPFSAR